MHSAVLGLAFQVRLPSNRQCLNRNCQRLAASRRRDFCRRRKSRPQILRRILQGHHNFEILRFLTRRCLLRSRNTRRAHNRVIPNFCDYSLKSFLRDRVDGNLCRLSHCDVHDVSFVDLNFSGDHGHIGNRHQRTSRRVLDSNDYGFAFAYGQVGNHAIKRRCVGCLLEHVRSVCQISAHLRDVTFSRIFLCLSLRHSRLRLRQSRVCGLPRRMAAVVLRFGDQSFFIKSFRPIPIKLLAFVIRFRPVQVCQCRIESGLGCNRVCPRRLQRRPSRAHIGRRLHVFQLRQQLPFLYPVAFLHVQLGDFSESVGADVDVGLRLDFTRCAHDRNQIQSLRPGRLDRDNIFAALVDAYTYAGCN